MKSNENPCVCNVFATFHPSSPIKQDFPSSQNVNRCEINQNVIQLRTSQDVSRPLRTFVLGGFGLFEIRTVVEFK